jgi:hypothetical protein
LSQHVRMDMSILGQGREKWWVNHEVCRRKVNMQTMRTIVHTSWCFQCRVLVKHNSLSSDWTRNLLASKIIKNSFFLTVTVPWCSEHNRFRRTEVNHKIKLSWDVVSFSWIKKVAV